MRLPIVTGLVLVAGAGLGACETSVTSAPVPIADVQPVDDQAAIGLRDHHRHHHLGGVVQLIAMSLDTLGEDDAKRPQVEKLQRDLYECMAPARELENKLLQALADAGTTDLAKADATIAQLKAAVAAQGCRVDALNHLHAVLSQIERAALSDKVEAHWEVWRQVNQEDEEKSHSHSDRLAELTRELELTADQVEKISKTLSTTPTDHAGRFDPEQAGAFVQAFTTAFAAESFDAKSFAAEGNADLVTHGSMRMARFYATVTPSLTPEQRLTLSVYLREHASLQSSATPTE